MEARLELHYNTFQLTSVVGTGFAIEAEIRNKFNCSCNSKLETEMCKSRKNSLCNPNFFHFKLIGRTNLLPVKTVPFNFILEFCYLLLHTTVQQLCKNGCVLGSRIDRQRLFW